MHGIGGAELCRDRGHGRGVIGTVRLSCNNFTQFLETIAQLVGSEGGNIIGMGKNTENTEHWYGYIQYNYTLSFAGGSEQTVYVLTTLFEFFDIHNEG